MSDQQFITGMKSIATFLDVSPKTLTRWIRRFGLPVARLGHTYVADKELLTDWLTMQVPRDSRPASDEGVDF